MANPTARREGCVRQRASGCAVGECGAGSRAAEVKGGGRERLSCGWRRKESTCAPCRSCERKFALEITLEIFVKKRFHKSMDASQELEIGGFPKGLGYAGS